MKTVVTKAEFAARKGRAPSAVSNWIAEGKITRAALVGTGVRAKIWVEQAERDLAASLNLGQQMGQPRPVVPLDAAAPGDLAGDAGGDPQRPFAGAGVGDGADPATDRYLLTERRARAVKAVQDAKFAELRSEREAGRWFQVEEARQEWSRQLGGVLTDLDTFLTSTLARELAERHGLDWKALAVEIRDLVRAWRRSAADRAERGSGAPPDGGEGEAASGPVMEAAE